MNITPDRSCDLTGKRRNERDRAIDASTFRAISAALKEKNCTNYTHLLQSEQKRRVKNKIQNRFAASMGVAERMWLGSSTRSGSKWCWVQILRCWGGHQHSKATCKLFLFAKTLGDRAGPLNRFSTSIVLKFWHDSLRESATNWNQISIAIATKPNLLTTR